LVISPPVSLGNDIYTTAKGYIASLGKSFDESARFLDFGCGWGRYLRFFRKDFQPQNMFGVDTDPTVLDVCRQCNVPGQFHQIEPKGTLPFPDDHFELIVAYSVFTHLPEHIHMHWVQELARVAKPGCIFILTLEPLRFLDFVQQLSDSNSETGWHKSLSRFSEKVPELRNDFANGKFIYIPTGGGDYRASDVYGEAVISVDFIKRNWEGLFDVIDYIDDADRFWQAVLVVQKP
jgi:SAM-dependent methyltransferase